MLALNFRSFRSRLLTFVLGLLVLVQGAVLLSVNAANIRVARGNIGEALELTATAFRSSLGVREQILLEKAHLLSGDFAFKEASATGDHLTLLSALENHQTRVGANVMMLIDMQDQVLADTLHPDDHGRPSPLRPLVLAAMASEFGEASSIEPIDGRPYQLVVVPLFTPEPSAWIAIGYALDDAFAEQLRRETKTHVSLLWLLDDEWQLFGSTLTPGPREELMRALPPDVAAAQATASLDLGGAEFVSLFAPVANAQTEVVAVLQRSFAEALAPFLRLRTPLWMIFALGIAFSVTGGVLLATRVTRPVAGLARGARRIAAGDYATPVEVEQHDELGELASSFNHMMKGLAERDRVREMLGKVVSPEIAEELLSKEIELGGEEREVSVLFTDVRDFSAVAESMSPQELVALLNTYLTWLTAIVERHGGVVEQYVGDAVMALFGAPLQHDDDALRAVRVALELCGALPEINRKIARLGGRTLAMGVGIHTDVVVAGNIGSPSRLNYKVVGDGVNLASRLEGLTKRYRVGAIVSRSTMEACPGIVFRELDRVRVKGRATPVQIYQPMGMVGELEASAEELLATHAEALRHYRARNWERAEKLFLSLERLDPHSLVYSLYRKRTLSFRESTPPP
ncbi:MAG: HAMP domain-containing protein, partial [Deltaproteobacteria bacterium]|nr:HAMP domain-containing protein [Deltaproteobacteria bacterium]